LLFRLHVRAALWPDKTDVLRARPQLVYRTIDALFAEDTVKRRPSLVKPMALSPACQLE